MRLATYNVEWFNALFDENDRLIEDDGWSGRQDVRRAEQIAGLGRVFAALDADAVMVIEAPDTNRHRSTVRALEGFAERFGLRTDTAMIGFPNDTQQEIALLYDPAKITPVHDPRGEETGKKGAFDAPRFDGVFRIDLDIDDTLDLVRWSKPPLELAVTTARGNALRMIGVHAKSKAPTGARTPEQMIRLGIENRRKQLAQCIWLRQRVDQHLAAGDDLIVLGDFNDGPGLDDYERLFGRSGLEIVLGGKEGEEARVPLYDPHARLILSQPVAAMPATARFRIPPDGHYLSALLDYIMVSPGLRTREPKWTIWHPFDTPACYEDEALRHALLKASDHFPVTLDIEI